MAILWSDKVLWESSLVEKEFSDWYSLLMMLQIWPTFDCYRQEKCQENNEKNIGIYPSCDIVKLLAYRYRGLITLKRILKELIHIYTAHIDWCPKRGTSPKPLRDCWNVQKFNEKQFANIVSVAKNMCWLFRTSKKIKTKQGRWSVVAKRTINKR